MMLRCPRCGCDICEQASSDMSTLDGFDTVTGTAAAGGGRVLLSDARALIKTTATFEHPLRATITAYPATTDCTFRLCVAYLDDDNYLFIEVELVDTECSRMRRGQRVGGVESYVGDPSVLRYDVATNGVKLHACWVDPNLSGQLQALSTPLASWPWRRCAESETFTGSGYHVALEVTVGECEFNDFVVQHHMSAQRQSCPRCMCSQADCVVADESFNAGEVCWNERSGDWDVVTGDYVTADADAMTINIQRMPDSEVSMYVKATVEMDGAGMMAGVALAYEDDDNFLWAALETNGDSDCGFLHLYQMIAGVLNELEAPAQAIENVTLNEQHTVEACYDADLGRFTAYATVNGQLYSAWAAVETGSAPAYGGLRTGIAGQYAFTFFMMTRHRRVPGRDECANCSPPGCGSFGDGFDAITLRCVWDVRAGSVPLTDGSARPSGGAIAIAYVKSPGVDVDGDEDRSQRVKITFESSGYSDEVGGILDWLDDDNYHYCLLKLASDAIETVLGSVKFFKRAGGVNTQVGSTLTFQGLLPDSQHTLEFCYDQVTLKAKIQLRVDEINPSAYIYHDAGPSTGHDGKLLGFMRGTAVGTLKVWSFEATYGVYSQVCADCEEAAVCEACETGFGPNYVKATWIGVQDGSHPECTPSDPTWAHACNRTYLCGPASCSDGLQGHYYECGDGDSTTIGPPSGLRMSWGGTIPENPATFCGGSSQSPLDISLGTNNVSPRLYRKPGTDEWWIYVDGPQINGDGCFGLVAWRPRWGRLWKVQADPPDCFDFDDFDVPYICAWRLTSGEQCEFMGIPIDFEHAVIFRDSFFRLNAP